MAKILRKTQKIFAENAPTNQITTFGTAMTASPNNSRDLNDIQNANFSAGWANAIQADKAPYEEDTNGLFYAITSQLAYLFQQGIPEWDANTTYFQNSQCSVVQNGVLVIKRSLTDNNTGNDPTAENSVYWTDYFSQSVIHTIGDPIFTLNPVIDDSTEVWLRGQSVLKSDFPYLSDIYGTTYGSEDDDHFNLPNFQSRTIWGLPQNGSMGYIEAGLPNVSGYVTAPVNSTSADNSPIFQSNKSGSYFDREEHQGGWSQAGRINIDLSRGNSIYGRSTTVQPPAVIVRVKTRYQ